MYSNIQFRQRSSIISNNLNLINDNEETRHAAKEISLSKLINNQKTSFTELGLFEKFLSQAPDKKDFINRKAAIFTAIKMTQEAVNHKGKTEYFAHEDVYKNIDDIKKYGGTNLDLVRKYVGELIGTNNNPTEIKRYLEELATHYHIGIGILPDIKFSFYGTNYTDYMDKHLRSEISKLEYQTYTFSNGDKYIGSFNENGPLEGKGSYTSANGIKHKGDCKDGKLEGQGEEMFLNRSKYTGFFKKGIPEGQGKYTYHTGGKYEGSFIDGNFNGQGKYTDPQENIYEGIFENDKIKSGTFSNAASGDKYIGDFDNHNNPHGKGEYIFKNGDKYIGEFKSGKFEGLGTFIPSYGNKKEGIFENGIWVTSYPKPLPDNSQVNILLKEIIDKLEIKDMPENNILEIKSKDIILEIGNDSITLEELKDIYNNLQDKSEMYCLIRRGNKYLLYKYTDGGLHNYIKGENLLDPDIRTKLNIIDNPTLFTGGKLEEFLKKHFIGKENITFNLLKK